VYEFSVSSKYGALAIYLRLTILVMFVVTALAIWID
jgi:hypothetical protein